MTGGKIHFVPNYICSKKRLKQKSINNKAESKGNMPMLGRGLGEDLKKQIHLREIENGYRVHPNVILDFLFN